jgi:hypothetical protein
MDFIEKWLTPLLHLVGRVLLSRIAVVQIQDVYPGFRNRKFVHPGSWILHKERGAK